MWITDFREAHGLSVAQLGAVIRRAGARMDPPLRVSDVLLENLEMRKGYRTVPKLANLIAEVCGATAKQRDALVLKKYRGKWAPETGATWTPPEPPKAAEEERVPAAAAWRRPVVCLDRDGRVMRRFPSIQAAAELMGTSKDNVARRASRRYLTDEFALLGCTFRMEGEWNMMDRKEQEEDMRMARDPGTTPTRTGQKRGGARCKRPVTVIDPEGNVRQYESIGDAARATQASETSIYKRVMAETPRRDKYCHGNVYLYTSIWELMSEAEKERLRKA